MIVVRLLLLLFAAALSLVVATPAVPTFQNVSPRGPGRKIIGDIPPPNSPSIRDLINLFRRMLPARQSNAPPPRADLAEIRRRYMITPTRRYPNAVFYVNQPRTATMNDANPNWGTNRALQLRSIIEAQLRRGDPNAESWTLYQAYDCRTAFGIVTTDSDFPSDIRRAALSLNEERDWFRQTSAAFAEMVTETVFLVVEEGSNAIGSDSIWATHELPAIQAAQQVNMIWEVRPANIGGVLDGTHPLTLIPYRDPNAIGSPTTTEPGGPVTSPATPPGSGIPPHDEFKRGDNPIDVKVDAKMALEARQFPEIDLSNTEDFTPTPEPAPKPPAPYKEGTCWIHLKQWRNPKSGGGSPFDNPNDAQWKGPFSVEISMYDDHNAPDPGTRIGYVARTNANDPNALELPSKLEDKLRVTPEEWGDYIQFDLADQHWKSTDKDHCTVGGWDHGENRQMDCHFGCLYGGKPSSDGSGPAGAAAGAVVAGNAVIDTSNAAVNISSATTSSDVNSSFDRWIPAIIGLLIGNLVIVLALVALNVVGRCRGHPRSRDISNIGTGPAGFASYAPVRKNDHDHDADEAAAFKQYDSLSYTR